MLVVYVLVPAITPKNIRKNKEKQLLCVKVILALTTNKAFFFDILKLLLLLVTEICESIDDNT